jgi:hypothetical protein
MRSAIFAVWSSVLLLAAFARAQEKPWEAAVFLQPFNTYYEETWNAPDGPATLAGNSFSIVSLRAQITYRARRDLNLPLWISVEPTIPIVATKGLEVQSETEPDGGREILSKEDVRHTYLSGRAMLGFEILPFLQPYVAIERGTFASRRTNQQDGTSSGGFISDIDQDYTETVIATQLGFGIEGAVPLNENADWRIRYDVGYETPQSVSVSNTFFGPGTWGEGTTGYTLGGRVQLDIPFRALAFFEDNNGYLTVGGIARKRHWNGDGKAGGPSDVNNVFYETITWPANSIIQAGGFVGIGVLF